MKKEKKIYNLSALTKKLNKIISERKERVKNSYKKENPPVIIQLKTAREQGKLEGWEGCRDWILRHSKTNLLKEK